MGGRVVGEESLAEEPAGEVTHVGSREEEGRGEVWEMSSDVLFDGGFAVKVFDLGEFSFGYWMFQGGLVKECMWL